MARYAQDFDLEAIDILADNGQTFRLKLLFVELNFFEDIFSPACSGNVVVRDALGIIEKLKLDGSEIIQLTYGKFVSQDETMKIDRKFRLYKVGNRKPAGNKTSEFFTMHFVSEELFLSEQLKITNSFTGMTISDMIWNILVKEDEGLNVSIDKLKWIQSTYGVYDFLIPKLKPFQAINWLSTYALPGEGLGADMVFFETKDGFYFVSLKTLFDGAPYATYSYQPSDVYESKISNQFTIMEYEFVKTYDSLRAINSGMYASRVIELDPITRTRTITNFNKPTLADATGSGTALNRFGKYAEEMFESSVSLVFGNSSQQTEPYVQQEPRVQGDASKDIRISTTVPNRAAQLALSTYTVMKCIIPGDTGITVGRTVNIQLSSLGIEGTAEKPSKSEDELYSGIYLVTAIRHIIQEQGAFQTVLELAKYTADLDFSSQIDTGEI